MTIENRFGTTSDMIIDKFEDKEGISIIAIDEKGLYITDSYWVDKNFADVNRYGVKRDTFVSLLADKGFNPEQLYEDNKHLIKKGTETAGTVKKINPLKASKRR